MRGQTRSRVRRGAGRGLLACLWILAAAPASGIDDWPDDEGERRRIAQVNEGDLRFLEAVPMPGVHRHDSRIVIAESSLRDGWVAMEQCHEHLDRVPAAQILFREHQTRALRVLSARNVEAAFAEGSTVQLRGIGTDSRICLRVETLALHREDEGIFELRNGPFMRRFLDGYYPLQLSLSVVYPASLQLVDFAPETEPGYRVALAPGDIRVEAAFEGRLTTRFRFIER